jgi:hypothetical protein
MRSLKKGIWIDKPLETKNFTKIKIIFNKISKFWPKKSVACLKMPRKWGVTIKFTHLVGFLAGLTRQVFSTQV